MIKNPLFFTLLSLFSFQLLAQPPATHKTSSFLTNFPAAVGVEGDEPVAISFFDHDRKLLFANELTENLTVVDFATGQNLAEIPLNGVPSYMAVSDTLALVSLGERGEVVVVNLNDYSILQCLAVPSTPNRIKVARDANLAFIAEESLQRLYVFDLNTLNFVDTLYNFRNEPLFQSLNYLSNRRGAGHEDFFPRPDGKKVLDPGDPTRQARIYDVNTSLVDTLYSPMRSPAATAMNNSGHFGMLVDGTVPKIYRVNTQSYQMDSIHLTQLATGLLCRSLSVSPSGDSMLVSMAGALVMVDFNNRSYHTIYPNRFDGIGTSGNGNFAVAFDNELVCFDYVNQTLTNLVGVPYNSAGVFADSASVFGGYSLLNAEGVYAYEYNGANQLTPLGFLHSGSPQSLDSPFKLAMDAGAQRIISSNILSHTGGMYDGATLQVTATVGGFASPSRSVAMTSDGRYGIWPEYQASRVNIVDLTTGTTLKTLNVGSRPGVVRIAPGDSLALTLNFEGESVSFIRLDGANSSVLDSISIGAPFFYYGTTQTVSDIQISPNGDLAAVTATLDSLVHLIDLNSRTILATVSVSPYPTKLAFDSSGRRLAILGTYFNKLFIMDVNGGNPILNGPYGFGQGGANDLVYNQQTDQFVLTSSSPEALWYFEASSGNLDSTVAIPNGLWPQLLGFLPSGRRVVLLNEFTSSAQVGVAKLWVDGKILDLPGSAYDLVTAKAAEVAALPIGGPDLICVLFGDSLVSIQPQPSPETLQLFPNPAHAEVRLSLPDAFSKGRLKVYDLRGALVHEQVLLGEEYVSFATEAFAPGLYVVELSANGKKIATKLIKP